ncbi:Ionotropic receptor 482 [Blattella germanica]|nr:Ionotropic receptor 482 [Blattella germanica]
MRLRQIIFLSLVLKGDSNPLPLDSVSPVEESLSKCVAKIANEYFNKDLATALFIPYREYESRSYISTKDSHVDFLVQLLHQRIDHPLVMLDYHNNPQSLHQKVKLGSYIIILTGEVSSHIHMTLKVFLTIREVAKQMLPSGRLLITMTASPKMKRMYLVSTFLRPIWRAFEISEAIVLLPRITPTTDDVIEVYKWFPEEQDDPCLLVLNRFVLLDIWIMNVNEFIYGVPLFQNNLITDMKGCVLNVTLQEHPPLVYLFNNGTMFGTLANQLYIIANRLNLRMKYNPTDRRTLPNLRFPFPLINVKKIILLINQECVVTYPYFIQHLKWVVPAGAPVPRWKSLIKIFNPLMWLCVVTTFLIGSITSWLLLKENQQSLTYISALLDTLLTYLVAGISDRYKGTVASTFFVLWLFYCLIINTAYQSALLSFLADPGHDQPIKTIEELHRSGLHLMSGYKFDGLAAKVVFKTNSYELCKDPIRCFTKIALNRDTALLDEEQYTYFKRSYFYDSRTKKYLITTIDESVYTMYFATAVYTHGCLLFKRMEQLVHRMWSAGLVIKDINKILMLTNIKNQKVLNNDPYVISLSHLQGSLYFLASGLFVSIIVFLIEIMYHSI